MSLPNSAFSDVLESLKVSGQILLVDEYEPPWGISIPNGRELATALGLAKNIKVIPFHIVRRGSFELRQENNKTLLIRSGEVAICTGSQAHAMTQNNPDQTIPFLDMLNSCMNPTTGTGKSGSTELVCGVFIWQSSQYNPLIEALPSVIHNDVSGLNGAKTLELLTQLLVNELGMNRAGHDYMSNRLVELVCAESIRQYLDGQPHENPGWFKAMSDPKIGKALNAIHSAPESYITVDSLAKEVGMSGSRFAARFRELIGKPAMTYVTHWRMNLATRLLGETDLRADQIAEQVGYESAASFSRTFSKLIGCPPAQWRKQMQAEQRTEISLR